MPFLSKDFVNRLDSKIIEKKTNRAEVCKGAKINHSSINNWSNGNIPSIEKVVKVAEFLNIPLGWLLTGVDDTNISQNEQAILTSFNQLNDEGKENAILLVKALETKYPLPSDQAGESSKTAT
jgi:transcriptional regulator with XRE-family HTH domain